MWATAPDAYAIFSTDDSKEDQSESYPESYSAPHSLQNSYNNRRGALSGSCGGGYSSVVNEVPNRSWQTMSIGSPTGSGPDLLFDMAHSSTNDTPNPQTHCFWNVCGTLLHLTFLVQIPEGSRGREEN